MDSFVSKILLLGTFLLFWGSSFSMNSKDSLEVKARKITFDEFKLNYSINDTSDVVIEIFFSKKDDAAVAEMIFLPLTLAILPLSPLISVGTTLISFPLFIHGSMIMVKYRKSKLQKVLINYKEEKVLPNWLRRKVNKRLIEYDVLDEEYPEEL